MPETITSGPQPGLTLYVWDYFEEKLKVCSYLLSFSNNVIVQVVEILPHGRQVPVYFTQSLTLLLMPWQVARASAAMVFSIYIIFQECARLSTSPDLDGRFVPTNCSAVPSWHSQFSLTYYSPSCATPLGPWKGWGLGGGWHSLSTSCFNILNHFLQKCFMEL